MYRIGIDIDDTICDTNELIVDEADKYDREILGGTGVKNPFAYKFSEMIGWEDGMKETFFKDRLEYIMSNAEIKHNAREVINKLYDEGNEIYFITRREPVYLSNPYKISYDWLSKHDIKYTKLLVNSGKKIDECKDYNIDIFIDDMPYNCEDVSALGINVILFTNGNNQNENRFVRMNNWDEIYNYIKEGKFNG